MYSNFQGMKKFSHALIAGVTALTLSISGVGVANAGSSFGSSDRGASIEEIDSKPVTPKPVDTTAKLNSAFNQAFINNGFTYNAALLPYAEEGLAAAKAGTLVYENGQQAQLMSTDYKAVIAVFRIAKTQVIDSNVAAAANVKVNVQYTTPFASKVSQDETYYYVAVALSWNPNQIF